MWCQIEKKIKNGTFESKRGVSNRKMKKKLQTEKRGVRQQKQNQKKSFAHQYKSWFCVWVGVVFSVLVAVIHTVLVATVRAVGHRC